MVVLQAGAGVDGSLRENRKRVISAGSQNGSILIQAMAILINPVVSRPRRDLTAKKFFVHFPPSKGNSNAWLCVCLLNIHYAYIYK